MGIKKQGKKTNSCSRACSSDAFTGGRPAGGGFPPGFTQPSSGGLFSSLKADKLSNVSSWRKRWDNKSGLLKTYQPVIKKKTRSAGRRYLYLVRVCLHPELHKIGISSNTVFRFESFEEDNPGKNTVLKIIYIRNAEKHEDFLLDYFSNRARRYAPLEGNGSTEVFALTWLDLAICILYMERVRILQNRKVQALLFVAILTTFIGGLFYWDADFTRWMFKKLWEWMMDGFTSLSSSVAFSDL